MGSTVLHLLSVLLWPSSQTLGLWVGRTNGQRVSKARSVSLDHDVHEAVTRNSLLQV